MAVQQTRGRKERVGRRACCYVPPSSGTGSSAEAAAALGVRARRGGGGGAGGGRPWRATGNGTTTGRQRRTLRRRGTWRWRVVELRYKKREGARRGVGTSAPPWRCGGASSRQVVAPPIFPVLAWLRRTHPETTTLFFHRPVTRSACSAARSAGDFTRPVKIHGEIARIGCRLVEQKYKTPIYRLLNQGGSVI